jgi:hypothetical protein
MIGSLILEAALSPEILSTGQIPTVTVFSLADLKQDEISLALFGGYYQFYFPWLTAPAQVLDSAIDTAAIKEAYAVTYPYIEDRNGRIELVQKALTAGTVSMNTMVRLRSSEHSTVSEHPRQFLLCGTFPRPLRRGRHHFSNSH